MYGVILPIHILDVYFPHMEATNGSLCMIYYATNNMTITICNLNILFITIDRYVAIVHPFAYVRHGHSLPYSRCIIGVIWAYSVLASATHLFYNKWSQASYCLMEFTIQEILLETLTLPLILLSALVVITSYIHIYLVILRHKRQIQATVPVQV